MEKNNFGSLENSILNNKLYNWASKHQCSIVWSDPDSPDLLALGCFALVIDRTLIKNEFYLQYLEFLKEVHNYSGITDCEIPEGKEETICILIDNLKNLEFPLLDVVLQIDMNSPNAVQFMQQNEILW